MSQIIDGKSISQKILAEIKAEIATRSLKIKLDIIQVGSDPATEIYVKLKQKRAEEVGIQTELHKFDESVTQKEVEDLIDKLNLDQSVSGFFIQTPISKHLDLSKLVSKIDFKKDVDGMNPESLGILFQGDSADVLVSATAVSALTAIKSIPNFSLEGKNAVVVGRSAIVGKPVAALLLNENCTVTIAHSKTKNLKEICKSADILVVATGKENLITKDYVKQDAVVIDCGAPKAEVDFEDVKDIAGYITPVPGGIGPLTIASLLKNCVSIYKH